MRLFLIWSCLVIMPVFSAKSFASDIIGEAEEKPAQEREVDVTAAFPSISFLEGNDELIMRVMAQARVMLAGQKLLDGTMVDETALAEKDESLLSFTAGKRIMNRATISALGEYCGLDWQQRSYMPFMQLRHATGQWSALQIAYIAQIHDYSKALFLQALESQGACTEDIRTTTDKLLRDYAPIEKQD